jgi:hypothetical protein
MSFPDRSTKYRALIILEDRAHNRVVVPGPVREFMGLADIDCIYPIDIDQVDDYRRAGWMVSDESHAVPVAGPDYAVDTKQVDAILDSLARHDGREASLSGVN